MISSRAAVTCTLPNGTQSHLNLRDEGDGDTFGAYLRAGTFCAVLNVEEGVVSTDLSAEKLTDLYRAWKRKH